MRFVNIGPGYDLIAPTLSFDDRQEMDKSIFDRVSIRYIIAC